MRAKKIIKTIDLFAGIGGIRKGFEEAGKFETVYSNDNDINCKKTYDLNFKTAPLDNSDVWSIIDRKLPKFNFLLAGFPCQAFSIAGYRHGFNDAKGRGNLFFAIEDLLTKYKPEGFLLENVKNLKQHDNGNTFKTIMDHLKDLGYYIPEPQIFNTMEYGNLPQTRERIYIVGFKNKKHFDKFKWPEKIKLTKNFRDLLETNVDSKYYYDDKPLFEKLKDYPFHKETVYQWRRKYVRENKKGVIPTLTANMGMGGHNVPIITDDKGLRKLTPLECFRAQGFDKIKLPFVADSILYKQAGNSVSVPVIKRIALEIQRAIIE